MQPAQTEAYGRMQKVALSDREAEAAALMKAAALLKHCQTHWSSADRDSTLDRALKFNQRLWSFFQVALVDPANPLPGPIKQNILSLSRFIDRHTFQVMSFPEPAKLDILININTNIAAGLKTPVTQ